jgi:hypothetical protein
LRWAGRGADVRLEDLEPLLDKGVLRFRQVADGRAIRMLVDVDGAEFTESWISAIESIG